MLTREQTRSLLRDVNEDAQWLIRMVENILSITRIHGEGQLAMNDEAAEEVVGEAARKFSKRFPGIRISVEVPDEVLLVPMDATLIEQVILNLTENAAIHGGASEIRLRIERDGAFAAFSVADNGRGIEAERMDSLFDVSRISGSGSIDGKKNMGIGLSVCRAIVRAHSGAIEAGNQQGGGACIRFRLPMREALYADQG